MAVANQKSGVGAVIVIRIAVLVMLAGCAAPVGSSGAGSSGAACERMCDRDYDACSDSFGARSGAGNGGGAGFGIGIGASCDRENRSCLERCRAVAAEEATERAAKEREAKERDAKGQSADPQRGAP